MFGPTADAEHVLGHAGHLNSLKHVMQWAVCCDSWAGERTDAGPPTTRFFTFPAATTQQANCSIRVRCCCCTPASQCIVFDSLQKVLQGPACQGIYFVMDRTAGCDKKAPRKPLLFYTMAGSTYQSVCHICCALQVELHQVYAA